jgi:hypothetical protein
VICAAKAYPKDARELAKMRSFREGLGWPENTDSLPVGVALCLVHLAGCVETDRLEKLEVIGVKPAAKDLLFGNYERGRWAWALKDVRAFTPFPVRGALGLWKWPEHLEVPHV